MNVENKILDEGKIHSKYQPSAITTKQRHQNQKSEGNSDGIVGDKNNIEPANYEQRSLHLELEYFMYHNYNGSFPIYIFSSLYILHSFTFLYAPYLSFTLLYGILGVFWTDQFKSKNEYEVVKYTAVYPGETARLSVSNN